MLTPLTEICSPHVRFKEKGSKNFADRDPGSKKQFTVDLSSRTRSQMLQNDGSMGNLDLPIELLEIRGAEVDGPSDESGPNRQRERNSHEIGEHVIDELDEDAATGQIIDAALLPNPPPTSTPPFPDFEKAEQPETSKFDGQHARHLSTRGQGGLSSSTRSDQEAVSGREGRKETCIVNAAFMASNFPHKGGKKFHKPIVIDLDLPVEEEQETGVTTPREET